MYTILTILETLQFRNYYFEPKHKKGLKTLRLTRLMNGKYNPGTFLKQLIPHLTVGIDLRISVGFSFIGVKYEKMEPKYSYFFAAQDLCTIQGVFHKREEAFDFAEKLEKRPYFDLLNETFFQSESGDIFTNSGIGPHLLVANYLWISK